MPAALLFQRRSDGDHVSGVDGEIGLLLLESPLPGLFKQRFGTGFVARRVKGAASLQQSPDPRSGCCVGEAGLYLVEQLMGFGKLALQRVGAGNLGQQLQFELQVGGGARFGKKGVKTQCAGGGILIIPQRHEIGRIVHLASLLVILSPRCLQAIVCTRGARHRAPLESC